MASKKGRSNINATGRRAIEPFVKLTNNLVDHPAWTELSPIARCIYIMLRRRYNGGNNGDISLSVRQAAQIGHCGVGTASKALKELQAHGIAKINNKGVYQNRHATTWILTNEPFNGASPTHEWKQFQPDVKKKASSAEETISIASRTVVLKLPTKM